MSLTACLGKQIGRLVHPTAQVSPEAADQHRFFLETRLAAGFAALGVVSFGLAFGGVPGHLDALVVGCLLMPFVSVAVLSQRGRLIQAEVTGLLGWVALALILFAGHLAGPGVIATVICVIALEGSFGTHGLKFAGCGLALIGAALMTLVGRATGGVTMQPVILAFCLSYAALLCFRGARHRQQSSKRVVSIDGAHEVFRAAVTGLVIRFDGANATMLNGAEARRVLGIDAEELAGRAFFDRIHLPDRPAFLQLLGDAGRDSHEGLVRLRFDVSTVGSRPGAVASDFTPIEITVGRQAGLMDDPSSPHAVFAQVRRCKEEVVAVVAAPPPPVTPDNTQRDRFLANISHELRTPLNAIIGFSEMLASDAHAPAQAEKRREYATIIHTSGQHLLGIVNSMLDLSKIDAGMLTLAPEPFEVNDLLVSCCDMVRLNAEQGRIELSCEISARMQVTADPRACRQIVLNLLSNALKFTPDYGRASVHASFDGDWLVIVVTDNGIGILPQDLGRIGDPFFQAQNTNDRRFQGTGLGLSVVSGLVGLHGGTIVAESAPGQGTRMTVRLPRDSQRSDQPTGKARIEAVALPPRDTSGLVTPSTKERRIA